MLVNEDNDSITINGIGFTTNKNHESNLVYISGSVSELLFYEHNPSKEDSRIYSQEVKKFLFENFSKESPDFDSRLTKRRTLYWEISNLAQDIDLIVEGLFFHIRSAIDFSHVKGDRGLLNSELPFHAPEYRKISAAIKNGTEYEHLQRYALFSSDPTQHIYPRPIINNDFINDCLEKHLSSLHGYRITSETHKVISPEDTWKKEFDIVFLNVLNNKKKH